MTAATRGNLPTPATPILGRDRLLASVVDLLRLERLVTLTGVGGVGKTCLAVAAATAVAPDFPDGVWMVDLAPVELPASVPAAVATALGIAPQGEARLLDVVGETLAGRRLLLLVDNCEHVLDAAREAITTLLASSRLITVLTTSHESLRVAGEQRVTVPPLPLDGGAASPAVALFTERARAVRPNFALDDDAATAEVVAEICVALDGLPLGIELAAARMAGMSAADVRDRLGDRFRLLEGELDAPRRQRTLPDLVRWSYELLDDDQGGVLRRAAVFTGGFDLTTYAAVYEVDDDVELLRALDRLVRRSLVVADHARGRVRYRMLETIRQFGADELAAAGELETCRDRHARSFAREAATRWEHWNGPGWRAAVDWVDDELANLRSAYHWSAGRDVEVATDIAAHAALIGTSGQLFEPVGWAESLLAAAAAADVPRLPRLYTAAGYACFVGRPTDGADRAHRATELERQPGYDPCEPGLALFVEALANVYSGNLDRYVELTASAAELPGAARAFAQPAYVDGLQAAGRTDEAVARLDGAVAAAREVENPFWIAYALWIAGLTLANTDSSRALSAWDEGVELVQQQGVRFFEGFLARDAARLHTAHGDLATALARFATAIDTFRRAGNVAQLAITLASMPTLFDRLGRREAAATLHAAMIGQPAGVQHVPELEALGDALAAALGDGIVEPATVGAAMDLDAAAVYARAEIDHALQNLATPETPIPAGLTRREVEVLRLLAAGLTTRDIAARLFISAKTADRHIQNTYTKIGTSTRATATRWAIEHGVVDASPT